MEDIPLEKIYSHPVVQELLDKLNSNILPDLENIKIPYIIKDKVLMSPGVWNNYYYGPAQIKDAFLRTKWDNKEIRSLYTDHEDRKSREWAGEVVNPRMRGEHIIGDLVVVDKATAQKLAYGAKMGISPKVHGVEHNNEMVDFEFDNFSIVINPAVKTAYINNMEVKKMETIDTKQEVSPIVPTIPEVDELMTILVDMELAGVGLKEILKKAKEIRKEGEAWKDAVARAKAMLSEELAKKPEEKVVPPVEEVKQKEEPQMSEDDIVAQIMKLVDMLKKKEYPAPTGGPQDKYPAPCQGDKDKYPYPKPEDVKKMEELESTVKKLSAELATVTARLNEPEKKTVKTEELTADNEEARVRGSLDNAILATFKKLGGM